MGLLEGKVVIVTGAGRGIGRAEAVAVAREGARVVCHDLGCDTEGEGRDDSVVREVVDQIRRSGGQAIGECSDIAERGVPDRLVELATREFGRVDGILSNAGIRRDRSVLKATPADLSRIWEIHVGGSFALCRAVAARLVDQREGGAIVLSTTPTAFFGSSRQAAGAAAGAAVTALTRSAAVELRKHGVRVNAVAATARTRLTEDLPLFQGIAAESMSAEHVTPLATFLLSDLGQDVSGEVLGVAGGRIYGFRSKETTGAFSHGGPWTPQEIADRLSEAARGA